MRNMSNEEIQKNIIKYQEILDNYNAQLKYMNLVIKNQDPKIMNQSVKIEFPISCKNLRKLRYKNNHCETFGCNSENVGDQFEHHLRDIDKQCNPNIERVIEAESSIDQITAYRDLKEKEIRELKLKLRKQK